MFPNSPDSAPDRASHLEVAELLDAYASAIRTCDSLPALSVRPLALLVIRALIWGATALIAAFLALVLVILVVFSAGLGLIFLALIFWPIYWALKRFTPLTAKTFVRDGIRFLFKPIIGLLRADMTGWEIFTVRYFNRLMLSAHIHREAERLRNLLDRQISVASASSRESDEAISELKKLRKILKRFAKGAGSRRVSGALAILIPILGTIGSFAGWIIAQIPPAFWKAAQQLLDSDTTNEPADSLIQIFRTVGELFDIDADIIQPAFLGGFVLLLFTLAVVTLMSQRRRLLADAGVYKAEARVRESFGLGFRPARFAEVYAFFLGLYLSVFLPLVIAGAALHRELFGFAGASLLVASGIAAFAASLLIARHGYALQRPPKPVKPLAVAMFPVA